MVKPSKSMQPEHVDLVEAGRKVGTGRAFGEDSFHNYMALKIARQREQFGLVLPPLPKTIEKQIETTKLAAEISVEERSSTDRKVRFTEKEDATNVDDDDNRSPGNLELTSNKRTRMESIISRLKRRHGRGRQGSARKKRRKEQDDKKATRDNTKTRSYPSISVEGQREEVEDGISELARLFALDNDNTRSSNSNDDVQNNIENCSEQMKLSEKSNMDRLAVSEDRTPTKAFGASLMKSPSPKSIRKSRPDLFFYGVVVKVSGYTNPDNETIKRLLQKYGGDYETYETERVTHIIAEQLSMAKADAYKKRKRPRPVCRPAWIIDCVDKRKLLPQSSYLLIENSDQQQRKIQSMFQQKRQDLPQENNAKKVDGENKGKTTQSCTSEKPDTYIEGAVRTAENKEITTQSRTSNMNTTNKYIDGKIRTVGTDPNFLDSYFSSSRLSFIGSFKQRTTSTYHFKRSNNINSSSSRRLIFHVDMDCFFASVALRNYPQYRDKPVVISHHGQRRNNSVNNNDSDYGANGRVVVSYNHTSPIRKNSSSECATCNYVARKYGIKKGMFLGQARQLCSELIVLNYDFEGYEEVSQQVLEILDRFVNSENRNGIIEVVSCDEAYVELYIDNSIVNGNIFDYAFELAETVRNEIFDTTQCTASIGIGSNKFLAKLGTDKVKPNRSYCVRDHEELLKDLNLRDLHGVGWRTGKKLSEEGLVSVRNIWDLKSKGENELIRILGPTTGKKIFDFTQGKDDRKVTPVERKTIGAECNYGVRFNGQYGIDHFMEGLSKEVEKRMNGIAVRGKRLTLKIKKRKKNAKEPTKFLGHGSCVNLSKSRAVPGNIATRNAEVFKTVALSLFKEFAIGDIHDIRGMGITISDIENNDASQKQKSVKGMQNWLQTSSKKMLIETSSPTSIPLGTTGSVGGEFIESNIYKDCIEEKLIIIDESPCETVEIKAAYHKTRKNLSPCIGNDESPLIELPPLSQIHMSQVEALPPDLKQQIVSRMKKRGASIVQRSIDTHGTKNEYFDHSEINSANRFRQTDLKRMMKLAVVKSGRDETGISLTQLDALPLEIKLQVVNQDTRRIGVLSPRTTAPKSSYGRRRSRNSSSDPNNYHINRSNSSHPTVQKTNKRSNESPQNRKNTEQVPEENSNVSIKNDDKTCLQTFWKDTMEIFIHQILYRRRIYPSDTFSKKRYIGSQCNMNQHPGVVAYIQDALHIIIPIFLEDDNDDDCEGRNKRRQFGEELLVEIYDQGTMITHEQFSLSFPTGIIPFDFEPSLFKRELRDMICSTGKLEGLQSFEWSDSVSFRIILLVHPTDIPREVEGTKINSAVVASWFRENLIISDDPTEIHVLYRTPNLGCHFQYKLMQIPNRYDDTMNAKPFK